MESFGRDSIGGVNFTIKKKRNSGSRHPISDLHKFTQSCAFLLQPTLHFGSGCNEGEHAFQGTTLCSDELRSKNKLKKLKLKLGGVTHTIHAKYASKYSPGYNVTQRPNGKLLHEDSAFGDDNSVRGNVPCKSRRVSKKRLLDIGINEDDDVDDEIRYLERLKNSKGGSHGRQKKDEMYADMNNHRLPNSGNEEATKLQLEKYIEGEEPLSDSEPVYKTNRRVSIDGRSKIGSSLIEFPLGLTSILKKQKAKLSEVEQQAKRAEAAEKRRIQSQKAAKEAEAEAIRKILGQDSARKKKEDKMKKLHAELAQGKGGNSNTLGSNTIRWVYGPAGTAVIFSNDIGLPSIFNSLPCSYPPPREKCAGPNCTNVYKYRDSKSKLPLCSLHCYKAIQEKMQTVITC